MTNIQLFDTHRPWEDWLGMVLGVVIGLSPWLAEQQGDQAIMWNAILIGALILALATLELASLQRWEETLEGAAGLWLIASPFIFGYAGAGPLMVWHFALGAAVVLLAVLELWQDWKLNDRQLGEHGY